MNERSVQHSTFVIERKGAATAAPSSFRIEILGSSVSSFPQFDTITHNTHNRLCLYNTFRSCRHLKYDNLMFAAIQKISDFLMSANRSCRCHSRHVMLKIPPKSMLEHQQPYIRGPCYSPICNTRLDKGTWYCL